MQAHPEEGMKLYSRRSVITTDFIGLRFQVHNGKDFMPVRVTPEMVGHKFGEFSKTRKQAYHTADKEDPSKAAANKSEEAMIRLAATQAAAAGFGGAGSGGAGGALGPKKEVLSAKELLLKLRNPGVGAPTPSTAGAAKKKAAPARPL